MSGWFVTLRFCHQCGCWTWANDYNGCRDCGSMTQPTD